MCNIGENVLQEEREAAGEVMRWCERIRDEVVEFVPILVSFLAGLSAGIVVLGMMWGMP